MNATHPKTGPRPYGGFSPTYTLSPKPQVFLEASSSEDGVDGKEKVQVQTTSSPLSAKDQAALDELAKLFTIQEERCLSSMAGTDASSLAPRREDSKLSRASLTSAQMAAEASFIYQHINFEVLNKCVPGFVKSNLNKNGRYLPETFILRVNYWRRRRALGEDSSARKAAKVEATARPCGNDHQSQQQAGNGASSPSRALASARSPRPQTGVVVPASRQSNSTTAASSSDIPSPRKSGGALASESRVTMISA